MLSYCRETALQGALLLAKSGIDRIILRTLYRSIFYLSHCHPTSKHLFLCLPSINVLKHFIASLYSTWSFGLRNSLAILATLKFVIDIDIDTDIDIFNHYHCDITDLQSYRIR